MTDDQWIDQSTTGPTVIKSILHLCAYIGLQILCGGVFLVIGVSTGSIPKSLQILQLNPVNAVIAVLFGAIAASILIALWQKRTVKARWAYRPPADKKYPLLFSALLAGASFAFVGVYNSLIMPPMQPEYAIFGTIINEGGWKMLVIFIGVVVAAPFVEELIFRAHLMPSITRLAGKKVDEQKAAIIGIVVSSVIFALIHLQFYAAPAQFVFGAALAIIYYRHKSLSEVVVIHALVNLVGLITIAAQ